MNTDNWSKEFPKLCELKQATDAANRGHCFQNLPSALSNPLAKAYFSGIENDLSALDQEAWSAFVNEILNRIPTKDGKQSRRALLSLLNEAKGYIFLKGQGIPEVYFIPRASKSNQETPDVGGGSGSELQAIAEVKSVWQSDYETDWIEENTVSIKEGRLPTVRRLAPSFPEGLKNKLKSDLQKASSQLRAYPAPQTCRCIVYFVIHLDYEQQNTPGIRKQIEDYLLPIASAEGVETVCDFQNAYE